MRNAVFSAAYLVSGAILFSCASLSNGGDYCGIVGMIFLCIGTLLSLWEPIKKWFSVLRKQYPS